MSCIQDDWLKNTSILNQTKVKSHTLIKQESISIMNPKIFQTQENQVKVNLKFIIRKLDLLKHQFQTLRNLNFDLKVNQLTRNEEKLDLNFKATQ